MFGFNLTINISDIISIVLLIIACVGIYLTVRQLRQNYVVQKATFFKDLHLFAISDASWRKGFYLVIYNKFVFDENFMGSETEKNIDSLLSYFDLVGGLYATGMLTKQEMPIFENAFRQVYANDNIRIYLDYLENKYKGLGSNFAPFKYFALYCQKELGTIDASQKIA
jgi:hypothetical protein